MVEKPIDLEVKYWNAIYSVLDIAGSYAWAVKLQHNVDADVPEAQEVLEGYYENSKTLLKNSVSGRKDNFKKAIKDFNEIAKTVGIMPIYEEEVFIDLMLDKKRRRAYKRIFDRMQMKGQSPSFQEVEAMFVKGSRK